MRTPACGVTAKQRRIALMMASGMTQDAIARFLDTETADVHITANNPRVQKFLFALQSTFVDDLRPVAERINKTMLASAERAQQVVNEIMEEMHSSERIDAKRVALASAQDILDRAGFRPTQRVEQATVHAVHPDSVRQISEVLREMDSIPTTFEPVR